MNKTPYIIDYNIRGYTVYKLHLTPLPVYVIYVLCYLHGIFMLSIKYNPGQPVGLCIPMGMEGPRMTKLKRTRFAKLPPTRCHVTHFISSS